MTIRREFEERDPDPLVPVGAPCTDAAPARERPTVAPPIDPRTGTAAPQEVLPE